MNAVERKIMSALVEKLTFEKIENPCDTTAIFKRHAELEELLPDVRSFLRELACFDIPSWRKEEILQELIQ